MMSFLEGSTSKSTIDNFKQSMLVKQNVDLKARFLFMPKLRTFNTFKNFVTTQTYLLKPITFIQKQLLAKIRLSSITIRIETGRFERPKLPVEARLCPCCKDQKSVENEEHFIFHCFQYNNLREIWIEKITKPDNFKNLPIHENFKIIFDQSENIKITA